MLLCNRKKVLSEQKQKIEERWQEKKRARERLSQIKERVKENQQKKDELKKRLHKLGDVAFSEQEFENIIARLKGLIPLKNRVLVLENDLERLPQL